jgi:hypothetical protein
MIKHPYLSDRGSVHNLMYIFKMARNPDNTPILNNNNLRVNHYTQLLDRGFTKDDIIAILLNPFGGDGSLEILLTLPKIPPLCIREAAVPTQWHLVTKVGFDPSKIKTILVQEPPQTFLALLNLFNEPLIYNFMVLHPQVIEPIYILAHHHRPNGCSNHIHCLHEILSEQLEIAERVEMITTDFVKDLCLNLIQYQDVEEAQPLIQLWLNNQVDLFEERLRRQAPVEAVAAIIVVPQPMRPALSPPVPLLNTPNLAVEPLPSPQMRAPSIFQAQPESLLQGPLRRLGSASFLDERSPSAAAPDSAFTVRRFFSPVYFGSELFSSSDNLFQPITSPTPLARRLISPFWQNDVGLSSPKAFYDTTSYLSRGTPPPEEDLAQANNP